MHHKLLVYHYSAPPKDAVQDAQGPDVIGAFGGALTAALDVMTFTHDLDVNQPITDTNVSNKVQPQQVKMPLDI